MSKAVHECIEGIREPRIFLRFKDRLIRAQNVMRIVFAILQRAPVNDNIVSLGKLELRALYVVREVAFDKSLELIVGELVCLGGNDGILVKLRQQLIK